MPKNKTNVQFPSNKVDKINRIYTDPENPGGYSGYENLLREVKKKHPEITKKDVQKFLEGNRTYTLFRGARRRFPTSKTIPLGFMTS
jgi:hypothetical protein